MLRLPKRRSPSLVSEARAALDNVSRLTDALANPSMAHLVVALVVALVAALSALALAVLAMIGD